jgi:exonuclease SbcD
MEAVMTGIRAHSDAPRKVVMGHAFVDGAAVSDSERPLSLGGAETIKVSVFDGITYVALGHLHRPQEVGSERVQYAGSLLKYSTSELEYPKSITYAQIGGAGEVSIAQEPVVPIRDFRRIEGTIEQILQRAPEGDPNDYVVVKLMDKGPVFDAMSRIREHYPHAVHIEREQYQLEGMVKLPTKDHREMGVIELFEAFFQAVLPEPMSSEEKATLEALLAQEEAK